MEQKSRLMDCQNLDFSARLASDRIERTEQTLGQGVVQRILCFALYLLGVNRPAIGKSLGLPHETAKSIIKAVNRDGLSALEDRRRSVSAFLPQPQQKPMPVTVYSEQEHIVVDFGIEQRRLEIPRQNVLQVRTILLSMMNSNLLTKHQVAEMIGLTPEYTATLGHQINLEDVSSLIDKRQGQQSEYRVTPQIKAEIVQQFALDVITRGKTSGDAISSELKERCEIIIPDRTVRHHLVQMGLRGIKHSLPLLLAEEKKTSKKSS
jgi:hypothetical protein